MAVPPDGLAVFEQMPGDRDSWKARSLNRVCRRSIPTRGTWC